MADARKEGIVKGVLSVCNFEPTAGIASARQNSVRPHRLGNKMKPFDPASGSLMTLRLLISDDLPPWQIIWHDSPLSASLHDSAQVIEKTFADHTPVGAHLHAYRLNRNRRKSIFHQLHLSDKDYCPCDSNLL